MPRRLSSVAQSGARTAGGSRDARDGRREDTADSNPAAAYMASAMTEPAPTPAQTRRRRLLFRATHRGSHETDLLVGGFVQHRLASMDEAQLDALEEVLELPDTDLADWLTGRRPIPPECDQPLLRAMRAAAARRAGGA
jgi:antitoxin CptB